MRLWCKLTYHRRLFLGLLVYSWLLVGCFAVFQYNREKTFKAEELNAQLQLINGHILDELNEGRGFGMESVGTNPFSDLRVSIINNDGKVVYDNSIDSLPDASHLDRSEISRAMSFGSGYTLRRHSESTGGTYFYSARKGDDYIVRTAVPYTVSLQGLLRADFGFLWFMIGIAFVMSVAGFFATRRIGLLVARLSRFAQKAERGERIYDNEPFPHDELGEISNNIVRLYVKLQKAVADRDRQHRLAIREEQEKTRIKKQLTNNINHELKTPVAAISVCLETLLAHKNLPDDKRYEFLQRCYSNSQRLKRLLDDVAVITRMDDGDGFIVKEKINIRDIVEEACADFELQAEGKGISVCNYIKEDVVVYGNMSLMMSVFHNLLANAIAYSGASIVELRIARANDNGYITVADNGVGVDDIHLSRLFERFYRVDKGRSRQVGGTGLGLAIVRNAVLIHGGEVRVENRRSGGLVFIIKLPLVDA